MARVVFDSSRLLDTTALRLLAELEHDARLPLAELGRRVGLTPPAVAERVRRLERAGVISGYRTDVDAAALGLPILAFVRIKLIGSRGERIPELAQEMREVIECHRLTGDDCFLLKLHAASVEHLEELLDAFAPFGQSNTSIVLASAKTNGRIVADAAPAREAPGRTTGR